MHEILAPLNPQQRKAASALNGPVLILAGAGSGKTKTLVHRIAYLINYKGVKPQNILAVTFTNKAAKEMRDRIKKLLGKNRKILPIMGTFHSICVQLLRREIQHLGYNKKFVIYDAQDSLHLIKKILKDLGFDSKNVAPRAIAVFISRAKNQLLTTAEYEQQASDAIEQIASQVYNKYQSALKENNALDFDDLIMKTVELFRQHKDILIKYQTIFQYILVDEYQDTNQAQYLLIQMLADKHKNICVVGDDYQSIYSWRGANMQNILNFEKDYPNAKVILLEQNYRSTKNIISASNEIIKYNITQKEKKLWTDNPLGSKISIKEANDEAHEGEYIVHQILGIKEPKLDPIDNELVYEPEEGESILDRIMNSPTFQGKKKEKTISIDVKNNIKKIDLSKYVILYRTNAQSRALEESFLNYGIPYRIIGSIKFYERKEIKDIMCYLRFFINPADWVSAERIINEPARKIGKATFLKIEKTCRELKKNILEIKKTELLFLQDRSINAFLNFQKISQYLVKKLPASTPSEFIDLVANKTGYKDFLLDGSEAGENRWENIQELKSVTQKYNKYKGVDGINAFLEEVSLVSDQDEIDENANAVNMMTIHAAKGLEFPHVFIVGMEEGLFPHSRSLFQPEEMEEERRLCYVALTRAKEKIHLVYAACRTIYGSQQSNAPSRFLDDLPEDLVEKY